MSLVEVLERKTGYLISIRSNCISFYMVKCAIFAKRFPYLYNTIHFSRLFPGREMPLQNSRLFPIVGTLTTTYSLGLLF